MDALYQVVGLAGVGMILGSYYLLQSGRWKPEENRYGWLNIAGSSAVLVSLISAWNLPSFVIQTSWISITLFGMWKRRVR